MVLRGKHLRRVEREGFPVVDPRKTCVSKIVLATILIRLPHCSGFRENYFDVSVVSMLWIVDIDALL